MFAGVTLCFSAILAMSGSDKIGPPAPGVSPVQSLVAGVARTRIQKIAEWQAYLNLPGVNTPPPVSLPFGTMPQGHVVEGAGEVRLD